MLPKDEIAGCILSGKNEAKENVSDASPRSIADGMEAEDVVGRVSRVLSL